MAGPPTRHVPYRACVGSAKTPDAAMSARDYKVAVQDLWARLPQDDTKYLINSTPDRVPTCIAARGGPMCY